MDSIDWDKELCNIQKWDNELLSIHQSKENPYEWLLHKDNALEWLMDNEPHFLDNFLRMHEHLLERMKSEDKERRGGLVHQYRFILALANKIYSEAEEL